MLANASDKKDKEHFIEDLRLNVLVSKESYKHRELFNNYLDAVNNGN
jgi:hypothetical protein